MATTPALDLQQLNDRFAIPGIAQIVPGNDGQPKIKITSVAASAEVYFHGAHITSWIPAGAEEVIFLSSKAQYQDGKAIRGGVPVCFPGSTPRPTTPKRPRTVSSAPNPGSSNRSLTKATPSPSALSTVSDEATPQMVASRLRAPSSASPSAPIFRWSSSLTTSAATMFTFQEALHTYYRVGSVRHVRLVGLDDVSYPRQHRGQHRKNPVRRQHLRPAHRQRLPQHRSRARAHRPHAPPPHTHRQTKLA